MSGMKEHQQTLLLVESNVEDVIDAATLRGLLFALIDKYPWIITDDWENITDGLYGKEVHRER